MRNHINPEIAHLIQTLALQPHPEGGYFAETWRDPDGPDARRGHGTAIYFLLPGDVVNRWHRVDAVEIWHHYAGAPLELSIGLDAPRAEDVVTLGPNVAGGERPQAIVPAHAWQAARSLGAWTLVGCTVSPAFRFEGFEMIEDSPDDA